MQRDRIAYKDRLYNLRLIDFGEAWGNYFVASTQLLSLLLDGDCSYTCDEASYVDEEIFYFIPTHYFRLPDDKLKERILSKI